MLEVLLQVLTSTRLRASNIIPAIIGLTMTDIVIKLLVNKGERIQVAATEEAQGELSSFFEQSYLLAQGQ